MQNCEEKKKVIKKIIVIIYLFLFIFCSLAFDQLRRKRGLV